MKILAIGLNHTTAPVGIREKLAFDETGTLRALRELKHRFGGTEFVLLSTCNRVELYSACHSERGVEVEDAAKFLSEFHNVPLGEFDSFLYVHKGREAVEHLFKVASSLDSMVVGEGQIIKQVKESYRLACTAKSTGKILNRLFHCAFAVSKKVHTTTSISNGRVSVAGVAVELGMQLFADISSADIVVIGAGEVGELLLQHLLHARCTNITIVNRSYERGVRIANRYGIEAERWEGLGDALIDANMIITSAASQDYLFRKETFKEIMNSRPKRALLIIDIAVPRNFEPSVGLFEDVYLYSIDELSKVAEQNRETRKADIIKGMEIVRKSAFDFMGWLGTKDIGPLIGQMKQQFAELDQKELYCFFVGTEPGALSSEMSEPMVKRAVNELLHRVIKNIDFVAKKHGPEEAVKLVNNIVRQAEEMSSTTANGKDTGVPSELVHKHA